MKKNVLMILVLVSILISSCAPKIILTSYDDTKSSNNFMVKDVLDEIKDVHPGTAGNSLKALIAIKDIMNLSSSNEYIDAAIQNYINKLNKEELIDFSDSVKVVCDRFDDIDENEINKLFHDEGIDLNGKEFNKNDYEYANNFFSVLSDITLRDYSND